MTKPKQPALDDPRRIATICVRIDASLKALIDETAKLGAYMTKAEIIRQSILIGGEILRRHLAKQYDREAKQ